MQLLVTFKTNNLLPTTQLILSKYNYDYGSKYLTADNNIFTNKTTTNYGGQAYLDFVLDASTNYILHIKLEQKSGQWKQFWFGLMRDSKKDTKPGWNEKLCYCEKNGDYYGLNTLVKGKSILTEWSDKQLVSRMLEVRINIQKRILRVGSLPNYESVVKADKQERIDPATPYRFFLYGLEEGCKMTILKLCTVSQFDGKM